MTAHPSSNAMEREHRRAERKKCIDAPWKGGKQDWLGLGLSCVKQF
ncbi:hypothetical protein QSH18_09225 [Xanthomonas sp. NCPPB 2654]|nr:MULTISPECIES: hypothetical protein [unclassified Xanthomonas]MDL5365785.1 hypothetical protein [Xanthomonas sp. NCPPB 2654]UYC19829.1 hypothetical protein NUG20_16895 [Xanthomonas sp. CFBP 8443]